VRAWGENNAGQCDVPPDLGTVVEVAGGFGHAIALQSNGMVRCWGGNQFGQCTVPANLTDGGRITAVSAGWYSSLAVHVPWSPCPGDLFADRVVNGADLGILLSQWGPATTTTVSDLNRDGVVNGADLGLLLSNWGPCPN